MTGEVHGLRLLHKEREDHDDHEAFKESVFAAFAASRAHAKQFVSAVNREPETIRGACLALEQESHRAHRAHRAHREDAVGS